MKHLRPPRRLSAGVAALIRQSIRVLKITTGVSGFSFPIVIWTGSLSATCPASVLRPKVRFVERTAHVPLATEGGTASRSCQKHISYLVAPPRCSLRWRRPLRSVTEGCRAHWRGCLVRDGTGSHQTATGFASCI